MHDERFVPVQPGVSETAPPDSCSGRVVDRCGAHCDMGGTDPGDTLPGLVEHVSERLDSGHRSFASPTKRQRQRIHRDQTTVARQEALAAVGGPFWTWN